MKFAAAVIGATTESAVIDHAHKAYIASAEVHTAVAARRIAVVNTAAVVARVATHQAT